MSFYLKSINAIYYTNYERRTKQCKFCEVEFCDVTKRNLMNTCSGECDSKLMVRTRKERGNYKHTEEWKRNNSTIMKQLHKNGNVFDKEWRKKVSINRKKAFSEGRIKTYSGVHWTQKEENKQRLSELNSGRVVSEKSRKKMSESQSARIRSGKETYSNGIGGFREDIGIYCRSRWEANFARILNYQGKHWLYEHKTFSLNGTMSYTPDFYVLEDDTYYELKGRMNEISLQKLEAMGRVYPEIKIVIIGDKEYLKLQQEFKKVVAWEGKKKSERTKKVC